MTSHRRQNTLAAYVLEWLVDWAIGMFIGVTGALILLLATLWVKALFGTAW